MASRELGSMASSKKALDASLDRLFEGSNDSEEIESRPANTERSKARNGRSGATTRVVSMSYPDDGTNYSSNASPLDSSASGNSSLAGSENRMVRKSKRLVVLVLIVVSMLAAIATYMFLQNEEDESWMTEFELQAKEVLDVSTLNAFHIFELYKAMALRITLQAMQTEQQWPFVTIPFFETEADLLIQQTQTGQYMAFHPLVNETQRHDWEDYSMKNHFDWIQDAFDFYDVIHNDTEQSSVDTSKKSSRICPVISKVKGECVFEDVPPTPYYAPIWQVAPAPFEDNLNIVNYNGFEWDFFNQSFDILQKVNHAVLSEVINLEENEALSTKGREGMDQWPESFLSTPIRKTSDKASPIVAVLNGIIPWHDYFLRLFPEGADGIVVVVNNHIQAFTYEIDGPRVYYIGPGDRHDTEYDHVEVVDAFAAYEGKEEGGDFGYTVHVYPTNEFKQEHSTNHPIVYTGVVVLVFLFTASIFLFYDCMVEKRQKKVVTSANKSTAIVDSLFPKNIRRRLMEESLNRNKSSDSVDYTGKDDFHSSLSIVQHSGKQAFAISKPIADLFPHATVMFADISNFTAWSSVREPSQVFFLLESLYNAFDKIARRMRIFKVETIGDCYVAVAGLPEPREDHAIVMSIFASKCLVKMSSIVTNLEVALGPETESLKMRFGLHSGPVTAGVLRGEKARFQLFGDTVNTASRMESTGIKNQVQMSEQTYKLLVEAQKASWAQPREQTINVKGKGVMQTYWLCLGNELNDAASQSRTESNTSDETNSDTDSVEFAKISDTLKSYCDLQGTDSNLQRLVLWNAENLMIPLKKIIASRSKNWKPLKMELWKKLEISPGDTVLEEVTEIINLSNNGAGSVDIDSVEVEECVIQQLIQYTSAIATLYNNKNPFHSFHHASHVAQSVTKLLSRVVAPDSIDYSKMEYTQKSGVDDLHEYTYGITSDPLLQFSVVFAALIHDVDHPGVSNAQLVKEESELAKMYKNKSVAEQNSVDLAWELLMADSYEDLRRCIYGTQEELDRFRKLLVNTLMATDVMDKELGALRRNRWDKAFNHEADSPAESAKDTVDRKATIVIEHMIQASDVAHTMQHWKVYIQWNERFFHECYTAYLDGRAEIDPSKNWYQGEIGFFDFYVIPLAKKLEECGVFGVSSHEYLAYAQNNRDEWEKKGKDIVKNYLENVQAASKTYRA